VSKLIETSYIRAKDILTKNKHLLTLLAEKLLEKEVIFKEDLEAIFGKRPFDKEELPLIQQDDKNPANSTLPPAENSHPDAKPSNASENGLPKPQDTLF
jgi:cell division protease FtsH